MSGQTQERLFYAAYSAQDAKQTKKVHIYAKQDGSEVKCTAVAMSLEGFRSYQWPDRRFVGVVSKFIRTEAFTS